MPKFLYGIQPTGRLHIGNYLGGLKMAIEKDAEIMVAVFHAMTKTTEVSEFNDMSDKFLNDFSKLTKRRPVEQTKQALSFSWDIQCVTPMSDLKRMTQFKDKGETNVGLFTYPCLMAADIILADPDYVIVGSDQMQHMEFYARTCRRLGIERIAKPLMTDTPRIMSIKDPAKKMSKSAGDEHCLYLFEDPTEKIMKAPTTPEGIANLKQIAKGLGTEYDEGNNKQSKENLITVWKQTFQR